VLNEQSRSPLAVLEVGEHRAREELLPHRLPEALDLAAGLRVVRTALHVPDAMAPELFLEARLAPPGGVLAPLVGEDLARRPVVRYRSRQRFHHERAPLVMRHHQAHQVTRVIIQERRHVDPLVPAQQEREEVRLPELIGLGALESPLARLRFRLRRRSRLCEPLAPQHPTYRRLRRANTEEALHHIANAPASRLRLHALCFEHRLAPCIGLRCAVAVIHRSRFGACRAPARALWITARHVAATAWRPLQRRTPARTVLLHPGKQRRVRNPKLVGNPLGHELLLHHRPRRRERHVQRPRRPALSARDVLEFRFHPSSPSRDLRR